MTDIGGGIFSLVVTAIFLKFWKPRQEWHFDKVMPGPDAKPAEASHGRRESGSARRGGRCWRRPIPAEPPSHRQRAALTVGNVSLAWAPFALMSILLLLTGLVRQEEGRRPR